MHLCDNEARSGDCKVSKTMIYVILIINVIHTHRQQDNNDTALISSDHSQGTSHCTIYNNNSNGPEYEIIPPKRTERRPELQYNDNVPEACTTALSYDQPPDDQSKPAGTDKKYHHYYLLGAESIH